MCALCRLSRVAARAVQPIVNVLGGTMKHRLNLTAGATRSLLSIRTGELVCAEIEVERLRARGVTIYCVVLSTER